MTALVVIFYECCKLGSITVGFRAARNRSSNVDKREIPADEIMRSTPVRSRSASWCSVRMRRLLLPVGNMTSDRRPASRINGRNLAGWITVWVKFPSEVFWHFPQRLGIFSQNFTCLLYVPIYARLQIFIQLSPIVTKFCHIKCDQQRAFRPMVDILSIYDGGRA